MGFGPRTEANWSGPGHSFFKQHIDPKVRCIVLGGLPLSCLELKMFRLLLDVSGCLMLMKFLFGIQCFPVKLCGCVPFELLLIFVFLE